MAEIKSIKEDLAILLQRTESIPELRGHSQIDFGTQNVMATFRVGGRLADDVLKLNIYIDFSVGTNHNKQYS